MSVQTTLVPNNPFVAIHDAFWEMLLSRTVLSDLVRKNNRVKLRGETFKQEINNTDCPEMRVLPSSSSLQPHHTSSTSVFIDRWEIQITTGEWDLRLLFDIKFTVARALVDYPAHLMAVVWKGVKPVVVCRVPTIADVVDEAAFNRGIRGWSTVWSCELEMHFPTALLKAED